MTDTQELIIPAEVYAQRKVGGTTIATIMGLNPYSSPYQVWREITQNIVRKQTKYMRAGKKLERIVAEYYAEDTDREVWQPHAPLYVHPEHDFLTAMPDWMSRNSSGGVTVLECKTTQKHLDQPEPMWFIQAQHYCNVLNLEGCAVAWLERGIDFHWQEYERDDEVISMMVEFASAFWRDNVLGGTPPKLTTADDVVLAFPKHTTGKAIEATEEALAVYYALQGVQQKMKELEEKKEDLQTSLKLLLRDNEALTFDGEALVTWKAAKDSLAFDADSFKSQHPELWAQFQKPKSGSRRFLLK
jgi:predicted phage-related endonuclease